LIKHRRAVFNFGGFSNVSAIIRPSAGDRQINFLLFFYVGGRLRFAGPSLSPQGDRAQRRCITAVHRQ